MVASNVFILNENSANVALMRWNLCALIHVQQIVARIWWNRNDHIFIVQYFVERNRDAFAKTTTDEIN